MQLRSIWHRDGLDPRCKGAQIGPEPRAGGSSRPRWVTAAARSVREALAPYVKGQTVPLSALDLDRDGKGLAPIDFLIELELMRL